MVAKKTPRLKLIRTIRCSNYTPLTFENKQTRITINTKPTEKGNDLMWETLTKLTKQTLIEQLKSFMDEGQTLIIFQRNHDTTQTFKTCGFQFYVTMNEVELDDVYVSEKVARMFHSSHYYMDIEDVIQIIEKDDFTMLEKLLTSGRQ